MDIVLERDGDERTIGLSAEEQALMNDIEIAPAPKRKKKAPMHRMPVMQETIPDLDAFTNQFKARPRPAPGSNQYMMGEDDGDMGGMDMPEEEEEEPDHQGSGGSGGYGAGMNGGAGMPAGEQPSPGYTSIEDEKADLLNKLSRLSKKVKVNSNLNAYSDISELRTEYKRVMYGIEAEQSIKFSRRMLIACVTGVEFMNKRFNPFDLMLDGWSESVMENVDDYDGVFEELYVKYRTKMSVAPEVKLIMMLGGSAMMFHLSKSMFNSAMPNIAEVMKQNPDLVKNMVAAVQNTTRPMAPQDPTARPVAQSSDGRREMQGPGLDISSLMGMGGLSMPPMPQMQMRPASAAPPPILEEIDDGMSDIVSVSGGGDNGDIREVRVPKARATRKRKAKGDENPGTINISI